MSIYRFQEPVAQKQSVMQITPKPIGIFSHSSRLNGKESSCWSSSFSGGAEEGATKKQPVWCLWIGGRKQDGGHFCRPLHVREHLLSSSTDAPSVL